MARIRTIKPAFWTDEKLAQFPPLVRMTFLGLISAMADDAGRCKGDVRLVKASVWPLDDDMTSATINAQLAQLARAGRILIYEADGARYIQVCNWKKHQRIDKPQPSTLPEPPEGAGIIPEPSKIIPGSVQDGSTPDVEVEVDGSRNGIGSGADCEQEPSAPLSLDLPKGVIDFLGMFYEPAFTPAARERYRDVMSQLADALRPNYPGPKIRGGVRVKARSAEHLERECRAVMGDPPRDRDMAVVIVLKRLTNPEPGPTPAEQHKAETTAVIAEEEAYQRASKSAGVEWANAHRFDYEIILAEVESRFRDAPESVFTRMTKEAALTQKCAQAAGFPGFEVWRSKNRDVA